jgi:hypothetical protein
MMDLTFCFGKILVYCTCKGACTKGVVCVATNPVAQEIAKDLTAAYVSNMDKSGTPEEIANFIVALYKELYEKIKDVK